jgi:sortase (surface protein transpeptidase)
MRRRAALLAAAALLNPVPAIVVAADTAPVRTPAIGAVARVPTAIRLNRLAIAADVVELGMDESGEWQLPEAGVGWYWFTATPGSLGNAVMVGHFDTWWGGDGPLARLHDARIGDRIDLDVVTRTATDDGDDSGVDGSLETFAYAVATSKLVDRTDVSSTYATDDERLTLVTCAGWWSFSLNDYTMRRVVTATRTP